MGREENVEIFQDTERLCKSHPVLNAGIEKSAKQQRLILEGEEVPVSGAPEYSEAAQVIVSKKRSYEAASAYAGEKVCVLNFASATNPGGGVVRGSSAQEECLCRCSTLYFGLNTDPMRQGFYGPHRAEKNPLHNDDCIYTPEVIVFKTDTASPKLMAEAEWYKVNVITCAAPNLRANPGNVMNPGEGDRQIKLTEKELLGLHEQRMRRILDIAVVTGNEVVILGAFGCGAFANPPQVVARAMKNVIREYVYRFKVIEFAVYCPPRDDSNYKIFKQVLGQ